MSLPRQIKSGVGESRDKWYSLLTPSLFFFSRFVLFFYSSLIEVKRRLVGAAGGGCTRPPCWLSERPHWFLGRRGEGVSEDAADIPLSIRTVSCLGSFKAPMMKYEKKRPTPLFQTTTIVMQHMEY